MYTNVIRGDHDPDLVPSWLARVSKQLRTQAVNVDSRPELRCPRVPHGTNQIMDGVVFEPDRCHGRL
jgi:hypothetical protein